MFHWRSTAGPTGSAFVVDRGFTNRSPGRGSGPYAGFNLGGHVGDDPETVDAHREELAAALGVARERLLLMNQVHGGEVVEVAGPWPGPAAEVDALVTRTPGLALTVLVADCVPVLLHDGEAGVVGVVHAGRSGLAAGVVASAVAAMRDLGASTIDTTVGPSVCGRCYEVPSAMAAEAAQVSASAAARSWTGTPAIDIATGVVEQLAERSVGVAWIAGCTRETASLYSHRRDGVTGRFAGVVTLERRPSR